MEKMQKTLLIGFLMLGLNVRAEIVDYWICTPIDLEEYTTYIMEDQHNDLDYFGVEHEIAAKLVSGSDIMDLRFAAALKSAQSIDPEVGINYFRFQGDTLHIRFDLHDVDDSISRYKLQLIEPLVKCALFYFPEIAEVQFTRFKVDCHPSLVTCVDTTVYLKEQQVYARFIQAYLVVLDTSDSYDQLQNKMFAAADDLTLKIDTGGRTFDTELNQIILPYEADDIYGGEYYPRRFESDFLSIEHVDYYVDAPEGQMMLVANISYSNREAEDVLQKVIGTNPNARIVECVMYQGCMH